MAKHDKIAFLTWSLPLFYFSGFQLDSKRKELSFKGQPIELTKKVYDLLLFLIKNPQHVHTKDDLITHVWQGRVVSGNTIDQTTSKLRKILQDHSDQSFIESIYGQGIKWVVELEQEPKAAKLTAPAQKAKVSMAAVLILVLTLLVSAVYFQFYSAPNQGHQSSAILLQLSSEDVDWEVKSASQFLTQLITFSSESSVKSTDDRPQFVRSDDFVMNQQKLIPNLTIIKIKPLPKQKQLAWLIEVSQNQQILIQTTLVADNFQSLIKKSTDLLVEQLQLTDVTLQGLLPLDDYVMALYVRGLQSLESHQLQKAQQQFSLAVKEQPSFHLARLKLAETLDQLGQFDASISAVNTLLQLEIPAAIKVAATTFKMRVLKVRGDFAEAARIYEQLISDQVDAPLNIWHRAQYEYAAILQYLSRPQEALAIYDDFIERTQFSENVAVLADIRAAKASFLQKQGDVSGALRESEQALHLFELNKDAVGVARTYSVLARIANQKAQYKLAETYLRQALTVTESVGHKLGEGAILNELIYALMLQGKHQEAWQLTNRLLAIGSELDFSGMQMAAYQAYYEISRLQKNWETATRWWSSYQQLAEKNQDERRLAKAQLFHINLLLDQNISADVATKIDVVQAYINQTDEQLMQAALEVYRGRYQWLVGQKNTAIQTLIAARDLAASLEDYESLIAANNSLAEFYIEQDKAQLALNTLASSAEHKPFAIPYLRIKAEAEWLLGKNIDALATLTTCQQQAAEVWGAEEQALLQKVNQALNPL